MKWHVLVCLALLAVFGCSSVDYGTLEGRIYTSGDQKVKITFPEGYDPAITAGYLENQFTCPDDFEVIYLDRLTGNFLICSAVIPPEQRNTMDLTGRLKTRAGRESVFAATARIIQQKHRDTLLLQKSETVNSGVLQLYTKMTDDAGNQWVGSLFFQLKDRWFWMIYEPASENILPPDKAAEHIRQQLFRLKNAIQMPQFAVIPEQEILQVFGITASV
ncbi:MAG: hypothetical protein IJV89_08000 [Lentisphaeria bacterium]|nr:hypothetical protein [Lentisphaeria bacterium]